jgi:trehalose 6-phosphate phosphatase
MGSLSASRHDRAAKSASEAVLHPRHVFRAWPEIRSRLRSVNRCAIFLDFDGTLVDIRPCPGDVKTPLRVKRVLRRLVRHTIVFVAVVSGRRLRDVQRLVGVKDVHYFGLHGGEGGGRSVALSGKTRLALNRAARKASEELGALPGIRVENKRLSFSVHYREADAQTVRVASQLLGQFVAPAVEALHILHGRQVWEVLPREIPGKFAAVRRMLADMPPDIPVVYIGDDDTDEPAFALLRSETTVRVGSRRRTRARYYLRTPSEVLLFLERLEKELC